MDIEKLLKDYKKFKDIEDIIKEKDELTTYYNNAQYEELQKLINDLSNKYLIERIIWNNRPGVTIPQNIQQSYINAIDFLNAKGIELLAEKGVEEAKKWLNKEHN